MTSTFREPIKVLADVLAHELELDNGRVMLADQKFNIANLPGIYISLEYIGPGKVIANSSVMDHAAVPPVEVQSSVSVSVIQVDIMSFDGSARSRHEEVAMALVSVYSQQMQEKHQCQISRNPAPFIDTSTLEATAMLKRYTTTVTMTALFSKSKVVEYFDTFQTPEVIPNE